MVVLLGLHHRALHLFLSCQGTAGTVSGGLRADSAGIAIHVASKGTELAVLVALLLVGGVEVGLRIGFGAYMRGED